MNVTFKEDAIYKEDVLSSKLESTSMNNAAAKPVQTRQIFMNNAIAQTIQL